MDSNFRDALGQMSVGFARRVVENAPVKFRIVFTDRVGDNATHVADDIIYIPEHMAYKTIFGFSEGVTEHTVRVACEHARSKIFKWIDAQ